MYHQKNIYFDYIACKSIIGNTVHTELSVLSNIFLSEQLTSELRVRMASLNWFKPSNEYFTHRSKAVLLLWIVFVSYASCWCVLCCGVCSLQPSGHLLGKG